LQCDVVVENFRPGVASRLGLGPELRDDKPSLIYASISGFGQTGPDAHLPAYDLVAQAMSGLMAATGEAGGKPLKVGESFPPPHRSATQWRGPWLGRQHPSNRERSTVCHGSSA
ncbi:MAG: hypothetical protein RLZZ607_2329, partial [Pseudomonadota bacterium]